MLPFMMNRDYSGIGWWMLWNAWTAAGFIVMLLRDELPAALVPASILITNSLMMAGAIFLYIGITRFVGRMESSRLVWIDAGLFLLATVFFIFVLRDDALRTMTLYICAAVLSFATARSLLQHQQPAFSSSATFVAVVLLVQGSYLTLRSLANLTFAPIDPVFTVSAFQTATFLIILITGTLTAAGLIIMVFQRANAETRLVREQFELIFNLGPDASLITRLADDTIINVNEGFSTLTGFTRSEAVGRSIISLGLWENTDDYRRLIEELSSSDICGYYVAPLGTRDGRRINCTLSTSKAVISGMPHIISVLRDNTERRRLAEERQRVTRMEALGQMAGGIADEFDELLSDISGSVSLAGLEALPGSGVQKRLEEAQRHLSAAHEKLQRMQVFSGGLPPATSSVPLSELLQDIVAFAVRDSNVKCTLVIPFALWPVEVDRGQLSQALNDLLRYLRRSIIEGRTIEVAAENLSLNQAQSDELQLPNGKGNYVRIEMVCRSLDIKREQIERIFDPFFPAGPGGLGLAAAFSIARRHGGHLTAASSPGAGITFYLYLPAGGRDKQGHGL
jgi:PAS domain S-box-containing protein